MPFRLTNVPAAFQCFMHDMFSDLLDVCIVVYLDDILIYSDDITQYQSHIKKVLKQLCKVELYAKAEKCEFHSDSVMNIEWNYSYYQPWSDNEWLVDEMIAMREEMLTVQNEDTTMQ